MQIIVIGTGFSFARNVMDVPKVGDYIRCGVYGERKVTKRTKQRNKMTWIVHVD